MHFLSIQKVIVELPGQEDKQLDEQEKAALRAGAAAEIALEEEDARKNSTKA